MESRKLISEGTKVRSWKMNIGSKSQRAGWATRSACAAPQDRASSLMMVSHAVWVMDLFNSG